jgi:ferric-dicitrate binding protein FerR (iron transport regulator)
MAGKKRRKARQWSRQVTEHSDALTLEEGVFTKSGARTIAQSLKRSTERSNRRKSGAYRSAMSMLTFYINRAGKDLPKSRKHKLENAKDELRKLYGEEAG